jgi:hypothetical protein
MGNLENSAQAQTASGAFFVPKIRGSMMSRDRFASRAAELARLLRNRQKPEDVDRVASELERIAALAGQ